MCMDREEHKKSNQQSYKKTLGWRNLVSIQHATTIIWLSFCFQPRVVRNSQGTESLCCKAGGWADLGGLVSYLDQPHDGQNSLPGMLPLLPPRVGFPHLCPQYQSAIFSLAPSCRSCKNPVSSYGLSYLSVLVQFD